MLELHKKERWAQKNWCFWTVVLEKTLESPLDCKEIQPVHPKGNQSRIFIGKTDAEAETPILWPPDVKRWLIWKDTDAGKYWRQVEKGTTEDEMVRWHHQLNGHEFEQTLGVDDRQGGLACSSPMGYKVVDTTKLLNWLSWNTNENETSILYKYQKLCTEKSKVGRPLVSSSPWKGLKSLPSFLSFTFSLRNYRTFYISIPLPKVWENLLFLVPDVKSLETTTLL